MITDTNIFDVAELWFSYQAGVEDTYGSISFWEVSTVTSIQGIFCGTARWSEYKPYYAAAQNSNDDISAWDVFMVPDMSFSE